MGERHTSGGDQGRVTRIISNIGQIPQVGRGYVKLGSRPTNGGTPSGATIIL